MITHIFTAGPRSMNEVIANESGCGPKACEGRTQEESQDGEGPEAEDNKESREATINLRLQLR